MTNQELKTTLLQFCTQWINGRHQNVLQSIADIETSLKDESKSTSGDKHHTGRAMLQIERENAGNRLKEIEKVLQQLHRISINFSSKQAHLGSLVYCSNATYFMSISAGITTVNNQDYICIASNSPIGLLLLGKKKGEAFSFKQKEVEIMEIS